MARLVVIVVILALTSTLSVATNAQIRHVNDRRDSYGLPSKVEAPKDIRRVRFVNAKKRVRAVIRVRRLRRAALVGRN